MPAYQPVPRWLWRLANGLLALAGLGIAALALALSRGLADPPRSGPLWLFDDFKGDLARWTMLTSSGEVSLQPREGALLAEFTAARAERIAVGLTDRPGGDFSFEVAGTPRAGSNDIVYGLVFAWQDEAHYSAVLVNGNGYAEAYQVEGPKHTDWFKWQQWPHAFGGANRVRVDVRGNQVTMRVNDELLTEVGLTSTEGKIGVLARSAGTAGGVIFSWVKVWAAP